jgi:hypothetical protein
MGAHTRKLVAFAVLDFQRNRRDVERKFVRVIISNVASKRPRLGNFIIAQVMALTEMTIVNHLTTLANI